MRSEESRLARGAECTGADAFMVSRCCAAPPRLRCRRSGCEGRRPMSAAASAGWRGGVRCCHAARNDAGERCTQAAAIYPIPATGVSAPSLPPTRLIRGVALLLTGVARRGRRRGASRVAVRLLACSRGQHDGDFSTLLDRSSPSWPPIVRLAGEQCSGSASSACTLPPHLSGRGWGWLGVRGRWRRRCPTAGWPTGCRPPGGSGSPGWRSHPCAASGKVRR